MLYITLYFIRLFYFHLWNYFFNRLFEKEEHRIIRLRREHIERKRYIYYEFVSRKMKEQTDIQALNEMLGRILIRCKNGTLIEHLQCFDFTNLEKVRNLLRDYIYSERYITRPDLRHYINDNILNDPRCAYYLQIIYG